MELSKIIATGLGTGLSPKAPGTVGSLLGIILLYIYNYILNDMELSLNVILFFNLIFLFLSIFIGVWSIGKVQKEWEHDASKIVIDEIAGIAITMLAIPFNWQYYLYGFIIFRFFDILKPLGIKKLDNMGGNWSVMLDDLLAGLYSLIVLHILIYFL